MKSQIFKILGFVLLFCPLSIFGFKADTSYINSLLEKSINRQIDSDLKSSFSLAYQALALSKDAKYKEGIGTASQRLGSLHFLEHHQDSALWYLQKALIIREESRDFKGAVSTCIMIKYVYSNAANYNKAFEILFRALRNSNVSKDSSSIAEIYLELGNLYIDYNDLKKAKEYLNQAEGITRKIKDEQTLIQVSNSLGKFYYNNNEPSKAINYFLEAEKLNKRVSDQKMWAPTYNNIALCYEQLKRFDEAIYYYQRGLQIYLKFGMRYDEGNAYFNIATMYINREMPDSAIMYLNRSLEIARKIKDLRHETLCNEYLSDAYAIKKDYEKAYEYHLIYSALNDSLFNAEKVSSIAEMQTKYSTEKKEQQIKLLDEQNKTKLLQRNALVLGLLLLTISLTVVIKARNKANKERRKSDTLLLNILPNEVANELKSKGSSEAKQYHHVTVLFTDFVNFTGISEKLTPKELVSEIHRNFSVFDQIIDKHGLEKIKTIGDAYMAVCGLPKESEDHAKRVVCAAIEIRDYINKSEGKFQIRIGVNTGSVVAGIVGLKKYAYDIWGDTVNLASRMESNSLPGKINISGTTYGLVKDDFICEYRGKIQVKGKGEIDMYFAETKNTEFVLHS